MSTATPNRSVAQAHARISNPLERLRKYIRGYVTLEGLGLGLLFLCVWFWVGLAFDWGLFKLFGMDVVQQWPWAFRAIVLVGLTSLFATVLLFTILFRLLVQFSDKTMAQVLEHRFPNLLGDRLITAVELNDPAEAAKLGYSEAMVRQTIHEAAEQVEKVPVKEVFNWGRLITRGLACVGLSIGLYLLVGGTVIAASNYFSPAKKAADRAGFSDVNETAGIWVERNILLQNTIWPRRSHMIVVDFPDKLRIPKKSQPPVLRIKAWKYVTADSSQKEGWRQLTWDDLKGKIADAPELPADWKPSDETTVDEVESRMEVFPLRTSLPDGTELPAKWCVATVDAAFEGWRPLLWSDLTAEKLGGLAVPALPGQWDPKAQIASGLGALIPGPLGGAAIPAVGPKASNMAVDDVEMKLKDAPAQTRGLEAIRMVFARLNRLNEIREAMDRLDVKATDRANKRSLRRLIVPSEVRLSFWSRSKISEVRLDAVGDNEFTGSFGELEEDITFTVRGEDYVTPPQSITVVDRPQIERLDSEESRPAYLYYRPGPDGKPSDVELMGKRQPFAPLPVSVSGETTTIEPAVGTKLRLIANFTKPVQSVIGLERKRDVEEETFKGQAVGQERDGGNLAFATPEFEVRREIILTLRFTDVDNVTAERKVTITPRPDIAPGIRDFNPDDVIRRDKTGYMITASARLPFRGRVADDYGLRQMSYGVRVIPSDFLSEQKIRSLDGVASVGMAATPAGLLGQALPWLAKVRKDMASASGDEAMDEQILPLAEFQRQVKNNKQADGSSEYLSAETITGRIQTAQRDPYRTLLKQFTLAPDNWTDQDGDDPDPAIRVKRWVRPNDPDKAPLGSDLGIWQLRWKDRDGKVGPLKDPDDTKPQKRFNVEVRLLAEDTYLEGETDPKTKRPIPHTTPSSETFTFVVVPENELLAKIGEEEEQKYRDLMKAFKPLPEGLDRLRDIAFSLSGDVPATEITAFIARCDTLAEALATSEQDTKGVYLAYERIVREMRLNQVREDMQSKVYKFIYVPLARVSETQFDLTRKSLDELRKKLAATDTPRAEREKAASEAKKELNDLVTALNGVLAAMEGINTINNLIAELARIEAQEEKLEDLVKRVRADAIRRLLKD